jgi:hypothetical protein
MPYSSFDSHPDAGSFYAIHESPHHRYYSMALAAATAAAELLELLASVNDLRAADGVGPFVPPAALASSAASSLPVVVSVVDAEAEWVSEVLMRGVLLHDLLRQAGGAAPPFREGLSFFCRFPFLLSAATKRELLRGEARLAQQEAGQAAIHSAAALGLLNGGDPAEHQFCRLTVDREHLLPSTLVAVAALPPGDLCKEGGPSPASTSFLHPHSLPALPPSPLTHSLPFPLPLSIPL